MYRLLIVVFSLLISVGCAREGGVSPIATVVEDEINDATPTVIVTHGKYKGCVGIVEDTFTYDALVELLACPGNRRSQGFDFVLIKLKHLTANK